MSACAAHELRMSRGGAALGRAGITPCTSHYRPGPSNIGFMGRRDRTSTDLDCVEWMFQD